MGEAESKHPHQVIEIMQDLSWKEMIRLQLLSKLPVEAQVKLVIERNRQLVEKLRG